MKLAGPVVLMSVLVSSAAMAEAATPVDLAFVAIVSQGGMFEVAAGKLAAVKGSTQDVRDFGVTEVHDHTLVGNKLKAISTREGIVIDAVPNAEFAGKLSYLAGLSGPAFDTAYLAEMASLHDKDGAAFAKEADEGGSAAYRAFGAETHRIVLRHIGAIHGVPMAQ